MGKKCAEEVNIEFKETFEMHHNVMHGYQALDKVSKLEFIEYYVHVSATIEQDSVFSMIIENVWNLDNKDNVDNQPFAGSKGKVYCVNGKQKHLFEQKNSEGNVPFGLAQKDANMWTTTNNKFQKFEY